MIDLPPNTVKVKSENKCDICETNDAPYYNTTYYIHICSTACFETFVTEYKRETEEIARDLHRPDGTSTMRKEE